MVVGMDEETGAAAIAARERRAARRSRDRAAREGPVGPSGRAILRWAPQRGAERSGGSWGSPPGLTPPDQHQGAIVGAADLPLHGRDQGRGAGPEAACQHALGL